MQIEFMPLLLDREAEDMSLHLLVQELSEIAVQTYIIEQESNFENALRRLRIEYSVMSSEEAESYMRQWFLEFLPPDADREKLEDVCLTEGTYLWHIFTFGSLKGEDSERASECFDRTEKGRCVVFMNNDISGFILNDGSALTSEIMDPYKDSYVTADDFSWTYAHTHEDGWMGPYFYRRDAHKKTDE
jgi:hypothetical protein